MSNRKFIAVDYFRAQKLNSCSKTETFYGRFLMSLSVLLHNFEFMTKFYYDTPVRKGFILSPSQTTNSFRCIIAKTTSVSSFIFVMNSARNCFCTFHLKHRQKFFLCSLNSFSGIMLFITFLLLRNFLQPALKHFTCGAPI